MAPFGTHQACTPAEVLQASQSYHQPKYAQRAKTTLLAAILWNIQSVVDTEGPIAVAAQQNWSDRTVWNSSPV